MAKRERTYITKRELKRRYPWLTDVMIVQFLPPLENGLVPGRHSTLAWPRRKVINICENDKALKAEKERLSKQMERDARRRAQRAAFISQFTPDYKFEYAQQLKRHFILHIGPTNSGKTYTALQDLKRAERGAYLGPLRLLALEVFDKLNADHCPCSLLTGEESIPVAGAGITSSTIEMADFRTRYQTAVIDEAQMISDPDRGSRWLDALCRIDAETVHVCLAPEAEELICELVKMTGSDYEIMRHERLAPLRAVPALEGLSGIRVHDAIIAFSRRGVLGIAGALEQRGFKPAVIYGSLPPEARRSEVYKYTTGLCDVVVATDAIGMGISLPIRRIVFSELRKFDGTKVRALTHTEILQIAGRAGRYGMFNVGEVTAIGEMEPVIHAMAGTPPSIWRYRIAFPGQEAIDSEFSLRGLLEEWQRLPQEDWYDREDMSDSLMLLKSFPTKRIRVEKELMYKLITLPVDTGNLTIVDYWVKCAVAITQGEEIPIPNFGMTTLEKCETQYRALDLYHHFCRRFDREDRCEGFRRDVIRQITRLLTAPKGDYIRTCRRCGKVLPVTNSFGICDECFNKGHQA